MGLDLVELVLDLEDEFGFEFRDEDYEACGTVGALYSLILERRGLTSSWLSGGHCRTQERFLALRRELVGRFDVARAQIRPSTPFRDVVGQPLGETEWLEAGESLGLRLPQFGLSESWLFVAFLTTLTAAPLLFVLSDWSLPLTFIGLMAIALAWAGLFSILPRAAPRGYTLRSMTYELMECSDDVSVGTSNDRERVWYRLVQIISENLSIPVDEIRYGSRFIEDLGAD